MKALIIIAALFGSAAVYAKPCVEGTKRLMSDPDPMNPDRQITVLRTCKNGSYYDLSNYIYNPRTKCEEGAQRLFSDPDPQNPDRHITVLRTCKNGSYYDLSDYVYVPKNRCKEGRRAIFWEPDQYGDKQVMNSYVCVNGKYRKVN
jgi:hypothetical protein